MASACVAFGKPFSTAASRSRVAGVASGSSLDSVLDKGKSFPCLVFNLTRVGAGAGISSMRLRFCLAAGEEVAAALVTGGAGVVAGRPVHLDCVVMVLEGCRTRLTWFEERLCRVVILVHSIIQI